MPIKTHTTSTTTTLFNPTLEEAGLKFPGKNWQSSHNRDLQRKTQKENNKHMTKKNSFLGFWVFLEDCNQFAALQVETEETPFLQCLNLF